MYKKIIVFALIGAFVWACATVPITGRRQAALVSNEGILPLVDQEYEKVLKESQLVNNTPEGQMVIRSGQRIQKAVEEYMAENGLSDQIADFEWEYNLVKNDSTINAWCMPGGKVAFYTGIIPICQDETGIAVVMGHEIAHALANHGRERMSQGMIANGLLGGIGAAMGQNPTLTQQIFYQAIGMGGQLGILKFSRTHESEADEIGLIIMAKAGYDPREAPKFWERMSAGTGGGGGPEFLSTHPSPKTRIDDLNALIPKAMEYYKPAQ